MLPSSPQEVAINAQREVAFTCPYCRTSRIVSVARYRNLHTPPLGTDKHLKLYCY
ncbi:MAG: hypothetical protein OEU26_22585 [Candidatus Tectomicrobia bacterium]|nr:hypothetical protein [Candidatus Tectomicrobia bacterium]